MTKPAARMTDMHGCLIPATPPGVPIPPPGTPGPILPPCAPTVLIGNLPAARMGDMLAAVPPHPIILGSLTVLTQNQPQARLADQCTCLGFILPPCQINVLVGG
ncbi:hypothetical protein GV827_16975 [Sulfitobacter sp. JBTF-M27]|uniref:Type VI secretion protein n=1 Tax=Sulfitobacter sediminilitoris TaxID=2698830 RepID=A0A6P0CD50_9RHOB|nr:PAAR domain-containing protein [Sulfitobacter sediminilitoris]NEK24082.1 hypothetical protein [Sulfitobacter sediminilitoris]